MVAAVGDGNGGDSTGDNPSEHSVGDELPRALVGNPPILFDPKIKGSSHKSTTQVFGVNQFIDFMDKFKISDRCGC